MSYPGWWVSPRGDVQVVATSHVAEIIRRPGDFGFTTEQVIESYERHNEKLGIEGEARLELILDALELGWVRVRRYRNYYSATVGRLDDRARENLRRWASTVLDSPRGGYLEDDRQAEVRITVVEGEEPTVKSMNELLDVGTVRS